MLRLKLLTDVNLQQTAGSRNKSIFSFRICLKSMYFIQYFMGMDGTARRVYYGGAQSNESTRSSIYIIRLLQTNVMSMSKHLLISLMN